MINPVPQNVNFYPGCYPVMRENHSNPEAEQFRTKLNGELQLQQAELRVMFLQKTLEASDKHLPNKEMTPVQRNVVWGELQDAQRQLALLKQQIPHSDKIATI